MMSVEVEWQRVIAAIIASVLQGIVLLMSICILHRRGNLTTRTDRAMVAILLTCFVAGVGSAIGFHHSQQELVFLVWEDCIILSASGLEVCME